MLARCGAITSARDRLANAIAVCCHGQSDIRHSYLTNTNNILTYYETSLRLLYLSALLPAEASEHDHIISGLIALFRAPAASNREPSYLQYHDAKLKAHVFHEVWAIFENACRVFYSVAVSVERREADEASERARFVRPPKRVHLPIPTIWGALAELAKQTTDAPNQTRKQHSKLVTFYSRARNTMHANTFFEGELLDLELPSGSIQLRPGEPSNFITPSILLELICGLCDAFLYLSESIKHEALIADPTSTRSWEDGWRPT
jgi:hypothetical protein